MDRKGPHAERLKALIVGGDEQRNIPQEVKDKVDYVHVASGAIRPSIAPDADVVVVITRWVSRQSSDLAREISKKRGIPILLVRTGNYILREMEACPALKGFFNGVEDPAAARATGTSSPPPEPGTEKKAAPSPEPETPAPGASQTWDVPSEDLWPVYKQKLIEAVRSIFNPGEKMDAGEFLPVLAEATGIPEKNVEALLPELAIRGVLVNTVGTTWKMMAEGPDDYTFKLDLEAAPKAKSAGRHTDNMASLVPGLPEGPYPSKYAIETEVMSHREFLMKDGAPIRRMYAWMIVGKAILAGFVRQVDGQFLVERDPGLKLTRYSDTELVERLRTNRSKSKPPKAPQKVDGKPVEVPPEPEKLKVSDDVIFLRNIVGQVEPPEKVTLEHITRVRRLLSAEEWDRCAAIGVERRLKRGGVAPRPVPKGLFTEEDWSYLAWETLGKLSFETVLPLFLLGYQDEELPCADCGASFVFSAKEQQFYYARGWTPPKRCPACRKAHREETPVEPFVCADCQKPFPTEPALQGHRRWCQGKTGQIRSARDEAEEEKGV